MSMMVTLPIPDISFRYRPCQGVNTVYLILCPPFAIVAHSSTARTVPSIHPTVSSQNQRKVLYVHPSEITKGYGDKPPRGDRTNAETACFGQDLGQTRTNDADWCLLIYMNRPPAFCQPLDKPHINVSYDGPPTTPGWGLSHYHCY